MGLLSPPEPLTLRGSQGKPGPHCPRSAHPLRPCVPASLRQEPDGAVSGHLRPERERTAVCPSSGSAASFRWSFLLRCESGLREGAPKARQRCLPWGPSQAFSFYKIPARRGPGVRATARGPGEDPSELPLKAHFVPFAGMPGGGAMDRFTQTQASPWLVPPALCSPLWGPSRTLGAPSARPSLSPGNLPRRAFPQGLLGSRGVCLRGRVSSRAPPPQTPPGL